MSSPDPKAKSAKPPVRKAGAKTASGKASGKKAGATAAKSELTSQDKADFLKALSKGIAPGTAAARTVARKSGNKSGKSAPAPAAAEAPKVEVLRRIPAPAKVADTPESREALALAARIEKMLEAGDLQTVQPHAQQALLAALCKLYAANTEAGERYGALGQRSAVSATEVMIMCGALLKAVDLQVFELGMWQSWSSS